MRKLIIFLALILISVTPLLSQAPLFESTSYEVEDVEIKRQTSIVFYEKSCLFIMPETALHYKHEGKWNKEDDGETMISTVMVTKDDIDYMVAVCYVYEAEAWFITLYRPEVSVYFYGNFKNKKSWEESKKKSSERVIVL